MLLTGLLAGCGNGDEEKVSVRPAMVERPLPGAAGFEAFPGDVRARQESVLSFRVGGKIAQRHVDAGAVVKQGQVLAELDPDDLRLQVAAMQAQLKAAQPISTWRAANAIATRRCSIAGLSAHRSTTSRTWPTRPPKPRSARCARNST